MLLIWIGSQNVCWDLNIRVTCILVCELPLAQVVYKINAFFNISAVKRHSNIPGSCERLERTELQDKQFSLITAIFIVSTYNRFWYSYFIYSRSASLSRCLPTSKNSSNEDIIETPVVYFRVCSFLFSYWSAIKKMIFQKIQNTLQCASSKMVAQITRYPPPPYQNPWSVSYQSHHHIINV